MLTLITGGLGSGKSLFSVILASNAKRKIVANFELNLVNTVKFDMKKFMKAEYDNCVLILDEVYQYIDSRTSLTEMNRTFSYILFQSRKKSLDMYIIAQEIMSIDVRFRTLLDRVITCVKSTQGFFYILQNMNEQTSSTILLTYENASKYFKYYNTNEIIFENTEKYMSSDEIAIYCKKIAQDLINGSVKDKITKADVRIYCSEKEIEKQYVSLIADYVSSLNS